MVGGDDWQVMSTHVYPVRALAGDYFRTSIGLILTAGPLFWLELVDVLKVILFLLSIVFLIFGFRTMIRQAATVMVCDQGIKTVSRLSLPFSGSKVLPWADLREMKLRYFSTRRDREKGWMQLQLKGPKQKLALDSAIENFETIVAQTARIAGSNGLALSATTVENMKAMDLATAMTEPVTKPGIENGQTR